MSLRTPSDKIFNTQDKLFWDATRDKYHKDINNLILTINSKDIIKVLDDMNFVDLRHNQITRIFRHINLHNSIIHNKYTTIKLQISQDDNYITYAYAYIHKSKIEYISTGPNMVSLDGEYRKCFSQYGIIAKLKYKYTKLWNMVEVYLANNKKMKRRYSIHPHSSESGNPETSKEIVLDRCESINLDVDVLVICFISQGLLFHLGLQQPHINAAYNSQMFTTSDRIFLTHMLNTITLPKIRLFYKDAATFELADNWLDTTMGQKIVLSGTTEQMNIHTNPWLEFYISTLAAQLIYTISPSVSVTYEWFSATIDKVDNTVFISEYTGQTINSIPRLLLCDEYKKEIGNMFADKSRFERYLFDIVYTLYCLNKTHGIIHGDLHMNNTTMNYKYKTYIHSIEHPFSDGVTNHVDMYVIDGVCYGFKYSPAIGTIIDYSRSMIYNETTEDMPMLMDSMKDKVRIYYTVLFPHIIEDRESQFDKLLEDSFEDVYNLVYAIDMYIHMDRMIKLIESNSVIKLYSGAMNIIDDIYAISLFYLEDKMTDLLNGTKSTYINPNLAIINKCFPSYIYKAKDVKRANIVDLFFSNGGTVNKKIWLAAVESNTPYDKRRKVDIEELARYI